MLIDKMNELKQITSQEEAVIEYINDNLKAVLDMICNELAKASYTSSSTIIRLCKKLGFKGYLEFKVAYTSEYAQMMEEKEIEEAHLKKIQALMKLSILFQNFISKQSTMLKQC
ncbi:MAG: hypothetical protein LUF02_05240 [Erysipelotrichaceae bacterium]|nr:hypothetical protein [Erysipelotrichaceae bacterium]